MQMSCSGILALLISTLFGFTLFANTSTSQAPAVTSEPTTGAAIIAKELTGKLAFVWEINEKAEIYIMNADGTDPHPITHDGVVNWYPEFSPDGKQIAFYSYRDGQDQLRVMKADGSEQKLVGKGGGLGLSWSPDGKRLAYTDKRGDNYDIFVINIDGTGEKRLTSAPDRNTFPKWSPDGKYILFESNRNHLSDSSGIPHIYIMGADGSNQRDLTPTEEDTSFAAWSPDGTTISYYVLGSTTERNGFYLMNADGSNKRRIHTQPDVDAVWSPDGKYLAAWNLNMKKGLRANDLVIMRADGSGRTIMTNFDKAYRLLSWGK